MIAAAQGNIDGPQGWLGRAIGPQVLEASLDGFLYDPIDLPCRPILGVVGVTYVDAVGQTITLDPLTYELRNDRLGTAWGRSWPTARRSLVRYRAGYAKPTDDGFDPAIPAPIKAAVLLMVGDLFQHRETVATGGPQAIPMSTTVEALLSPFRVWS